MILSYQECLDKYGSDYKLKKELSDGKLFMEEKGLYSTKRNTTELDLIMKKYPRAVCTGYSAFYYHALTDVIPEHYYLATIRTDTRIRDTRIKQSYVKEELFRAGIGTLKYNSSTIRIYNCERMLIELLRFRSKLPMDYYKEIIRNYRKLSSTMDFTLVEDYALNFRNTSSLMDMVQREVL